VSGILVFKLSLGCIIAEITSAVKAMTEEGEGAEVLVYAQNGSVWGAERLSEAAWRQRRRRATATATVQAAAWHSIGVNACTCTCDCNALISRVKDLRSKLLRAVICLDLLLSGSKQITILNILYYFLYLTLSSSTLFDGFLTGVEILRASESLYRQVVLGMVARWAEVIIYSKKGEEFLRGKMQKEKRWSSPHGGDLENKGMLRVESLK
jgi:hypothetical protein